MTRPLWRLLLTANFGRASRYPLRSAVLRLALAAALSLAIGLSLASTAATAPLPSGLPISWLAGITAAAAFGVTGLVCLSLTAAVSRGGDSQAKLIQLLPLTRSPRWALKVLPMLIIWLLGLILVTPAVVALGHAAHVFVLALVSALVAGSLSGVGAVMFPQPRSILLKSVALISSIILSSWLLTYYAEHSAHPVAWPLLALAALLTAPLYGFAGAYFHSGRSLAPHGSRPLATMPDSLVPGSWFSLKLLRNSRSLVSLVFCFTVIFAAAAAVDVRHLAASGGPSWLILGAILATATAADIRGLVPRRRAPEIEALRGPGHFIIVEATSTLVLALIIGLPMFTVLLGAHVAPPHSLFFDYLGLQVAAAMIGLLASTIFVPGHGDLGSQFFAAAGSTALLLVLPKLLHVHRLAPGWQAAVWVAVAAACFGVINLIENKRRTLA
jgi:hypothetical protein